MRHSTFGVAVQGYHCYTVLLTLRLWFYEPYLRLFSTFLKYKFVITFTFLILCGLPRNKSDRTSRD